MTLSSLFHNASMGALLFGLILLSGCATSQTAYLQDGTAGYAVECNGLLGHWSSCHSEAALLCGDESYRVISRNRLDGITEEEAETLSSREAYRERSMLVQCNGHQISWRVGLLPHRSSLERSS
ncbi:MULTISPECIES: hypothetical protein [Pseudomonas]|uniref:Lipoprotein n=1 Tax=Pseudomonas lutea TaxID=243924 RepID=A0A9X8QL65_9PSED|nr:MULTISPECIES: hypothetical protein [Pseudomonas]MBW5415798.1 hypothetical protein [Pseudomonas sp. MAG002Y]SER18256.1 hypothetical protein SAMN05216409_113120 [Pseudomonas lutea]